MKGRSVIFKGRYTALRFNKLLELLPSISPPQKAGVFHDFQALPSFRPDHKRRKLADQALIQPAPIRFFKENTQRAWQRQALPIRAITGQRVADVHDLEYAHSQRDVLSLQTVGVAAAIHAFVMVANDGQDVTERFERRADLLSEDGMLFDNPHLFGIQRSGLGQNAVRDSDLADIVDQTSDS